MGRIKSVHKVIENLEVKEAYAPCVSHFEEIKQNGHGIWDMMWDSFKFGYLQGMKAAKAERRRVA